MFGTSFNGLHVSVERFRFFGVKACGIDELGGYAIGDEMGGMANIGGEEGKASLSRRVIVGVRSVRRRAGRFNGVSRRY